MQYTCHVLFAFYISYLHTFIGVLTTIPHQCEAVCRSGTNAVRRTEANYWTSFQRVGSLNTVR